MATYAIGDVQGCYSELMRLLNAIHFKSDRDQLWFVGDLVNRGPDSLKVLRFVHDLGAQAVTVLGNHDLHLLALASGVGKPRPLDTFNKIFDAPDRDELLRWLVQQPILHHDPELDVIMVHAGLAPQWDLALAQSCAREVQSVLRGPNVEKFYLHMYGNQPDRWHSQLRGWGRIRYIVNCFTRMRYFDAQSCLNLREKGPPAESKGLIPWFDLPDRKNRDLDIVFGHWSALGSAGTAAVSVFGSQSKPKAGHVSCLDSGCLWGGHLTAVRLQYPRQTYRIACQQMLALPSEAVRE